MKIKKGRCFIVAEAGSNHNGSVKLGKKLIRAAKECGCDAVKFQAFKTERLVTRKAAKADYQKDNSKGKGQFEMLKSLELSAKEHCRLVKYAKEECIEIFYSVFDQESVDMVVKAGIKVIKLGSGELTNIPLIKYIAKCGLPLIISTGMGTDGEIKDAVEAFRSRTKASLILMNCSTGYPSRMEDANLRRIQYLKRKFGAPCGNSDHTKGILVSVISACLGVPLIEKHFTIDKGLAGPDHKMSMDPQDLKKLCSLIRLVEKKPAREKALLSMLKGIGFKVGKGEIEKILGKGKRKIPNSEKRERIWARKSLVAAIDIRPQEFITEGNLAIKRPEEGIAPGDYEVVLGRRARLFIKEGTPIKWPMLA